MVRIVIVKGGFKRTGYTVYKKYKSGGEEMLEHFARKAQAEMFREWYKKGKVRGRYEKR